MEPAMEWVQKAEEVITEYRYMVNRVAWLLQELDRAISGTGAPGSSLVVQYGIEAIMPKEREQNRYPLTFQKNYTNGS